MGVTVSSNSALTSDPNTHLVAYPSGCTIVLYNSSTCKQQSHIVNICRKTITALAFSSDGRYLVTGECGHLPSVRIWDLQDTSGNPGGTQIAEFQGHQYGVNCVAFSPSNKYVVSVGSQHDMIVNVWDWKNNLKIASNKVSTKVKNVCFAQDGSYFVTVGNRHVKFWYLEYTRNAKYKEAVPLVGRAAILGSQRGQNFVAVACGRGESAENTYAVTKSGLLCQLNNRRLLDKWLELRTTSASCMTVGEKHIFVGCAEGIVRCFDPVSLKFVTTLPRTHHLGVDVSLGTNISHISSHPSNAKYPDTVAITYDEQNSKLTCVYNDHSIYIWDVREVKRVGKSQSFLYHSACIWGIEMLPTREEISQYRKPTTDIFPDGCFVTCSSDDTIRIWNLDSNAPPANIYSSELLKIIYMDPDLNYIKDQDQTTISNNDKADTSYDGKNGVRCIRIRPDGLHLASGDRAGNIKIHDMRTMKEIFKIEAHDAEVLCLEYSRNQQLNSSTGGYPRLLASASRDRLIHVFNIDNNYNILQTLDDHSSSITAVRFISTPTNLKMISCGADKSIIFRNLAMGAGETEFSFNRDYNVAGRTTLYDMEIDSTGRHILTACQDRTIRVYSTRSGHYVRSLRGSPSEDGSLIKVTLDTAGRYMATSCTDKTLSVYCSWSGQLLGNVSGHSELATGLKFSRNGERLVSAGGDASILLWKQKQLKKSLIITNSVEADNDKLEMSSPEIFENNVSLDTSDYRFSVGPLPLWAKKQITEDLNQPGSLQKGVDLPKGRWAQRVEQSGISVRSVYDTDSIISFPNRQETIQDSDCSKDSSIDSGTESRNFSEYRKETSIKFKQDSQVDDDFVPCPESLLEITSNSMQTYSPPSLISNRSGSGIRQTSHPHTDDSSLGSMLGGSSAIGGDTCEDSAAEHDGDVEDCYDAELKSRHDNRSSKVQFPDGILDSPSEFTVNAISVDELRKSQRKSKNKRDLPFISVSTTSVSGSQESDFDDDDASTPSGDNTDKNPTSLLSASTESLDTIGNRGKYLQSAFDSLSGAEQDMSSGKHTLSALHHNTRISNSGVAPRNIPIVNEAKQYKTDNSASQKREELNRRIEETRMKLQSVGYKSNLKSSQSVLDLSPVPEKQLKGNSKLNTLHGTKNVNLHALQPEQVNDTFNSRNKINKHDFNIPANINIKNHFKTLPFFNEPTNKNEETIPMTNLYDTLINKFNEDMRHLVLQTENGDSFLPTIQTQLPSVENVTEKSRNYVTECKEKFELGIENQNRPNLLNLNSKNVRSNSIFKMHKSLPVSPVTEEAKLSDYCSTQCSDHVSSNIDLRVQSNFKHKYDNQFAQIQHSYQKRQSLSYYVDFEKNHGLKTNAKNIYGTDDMKNDFPNNQSVVTRNNDDDEDNFSSDSLEECSLTSNRIKKYSKMQESRRCISNYDIFQEGSQEVLDMTPINTYVNLPRSSSALLKRVVTYSNESINSNELDIPISEQNLTRSRESILSNDKSETNDNYNIYPEYERHSSASFYLRQSRVPPSISQESILSNFSDSADYSWKMNEEQCLGEKLSNTNCNSLESILSDESVDTQSAPLEVLFRTNRRRKNSETEPDNHEKYEYAHGSTDKATKLEPNYVHRTLMKFEPEHKLVTRSKSFQESQKQNISYFIGDEVKTSNRPKLTHKKTYEYEKIPSSNAHQIANRNRQQENIPTLQNKNDQYEKKSSDFWSGNKMIAKSKSCSFEITFDLCPSERLTNKTSEANTTATTTSKPTSLKQTSKYNIVTKSLDRNRNNALQNYPNIYPLQSKAQKTPFTTQSLDRNSSNQPFTNQNKDDRGFETLFGDIVKHKPPKGMRRSASAKIKNKTMKTGLDDRRNSDSFTHFNTRDQENLLPTNQLERSFKIMDCASDVRSLALSYYEPSNKTGICEDLVKSDNTSDNCIVIKPDIHLKEHDIENDPNVPERDFDRVMTNPKNKIENTYTNVHQPSKYMIDNTLNPYLPLCSPENDALNTNLLNDNPIGLADMNITTKIKDTKYLSSEDIIKFRDIERKIEIINKLVEIEEQKISKGKVKRLSKNFERMALENQSHAFACRVKRNLSLPTIFDANCTSLSINHEPPTTRKNKTKTEPQKICNENNSSRNFKPLWPPATRCPINNNLKSRINNFLHNTKPFELMKGKNVNKNTLDGKIKGQVPVSPPDVDESENGLRRACSLSDLTDPTPTKHKTPNQVPAKVLNKSTLRNQQSSQRYNKSAMTRSSSVGMLNQSESDTEINSLNNAFALPKALPRSNLMRPTISSQNKATNANIKNNLRRRIVQSSYSTANLTMVGQEDSSSDDQQHVKNGITVNKLSGRNRSHSIDHTAGMGNPWQQVQRVNRNKESSSGKFRGSRNSIVSNDKPGPDNVSKEPDFDVANSELTTQLCNQIAEQLTRTADNVVQLYKRLTLNSESNSPDSSSNIQEDLDKSHMMKNLESAMLETQKILQLAVKKQEQQQLGIKSDNNVSADVTLSHNHLRELVALNSTGGDNADHANVVLMMQQYSDILLNMMQQRMEQRH